MGVVLMGGGGLLEGYCRNLDVCNPAIQDHFVSDRIRVECPAGTYSWLEVRTVNHRFSTDPGAVAEPSRLIQFMPTNREARWNLLCIIFQATTIESLNINRAVLGLLGSADRRDRHYAQSAYWQNYTIKVHVSMGGPFNVAMESKQGAVTQKVSGICTIV